MPRCPVPRCRVARWNVAHCVSHVRQFGSTSRWLCRVLGLHSHARSDPTYGAAAILRRRAAHRRDASNRAPQPRRSVARGIGAASARHRRGRTLRWRRACCASRRTRGPSASTRKGTYLWSAEAVNSTPQPARRAGGVTSARVPPVRSPTSTQQRLDGPEPSPGADVGGVSPVPVQLWEQGVSQVPVQMWEQGVSQVPMQMWEG